ncbi:MAG: DNA polymerase III subunit delta [Spirochaetaceae bacterium]
MSDNRVFLLLGPEQGEKAREVKRIRALAAKQAAAGGGSETDVEEHRFYAFETPIQDALSLLRSGSLFARHTLVLIHGVEELRRAEDLDLLETYLTHPSETGTLVLLSDEFRIKDPRSKKDWTKRIPQDNHKIFWELFENQKRDWLWSYFRRRNVATDEEAIELILELVENNTLELKRAAGRLATFVGEGGRLGAEEVESYLYHSKEENVFTLFRAVAERDLDGSLELLRKLMLSGDASPHSIMAGLLWQLRKLHDSAALTARHYSTDEAFRRVGIRGKRNQKMYAAALSRYSVEALERIVVRAVDTDAALRQYNARAHELLLDRFLYNVIVGDGETVEAGGVTAD